MRSKAPSSNSVRALEKRHSATSSSQEAGKLKASSSDPAKALAKLRISKRTDHQRPSGQWPTGLKFSREISRATSSSFSGRDARGQRKDDSLLRTQGRRLRGGWWHPDEINERNVDYEKLAELVHDLTSKHPELPEFVETVNNLTNEYIEQER
jgi:hypothetical protein